MLESTKINPFRRFLTGEPFSIQSSSPQDLQNLNAQSFQSICTSFLDKRQGQQLNETMCDDDDMPSSSGCSSASSTSGGDEELSKTNTGDTDSLMESKPFDLATPDSIDLKEKAMREVDRVMKKGYVDDFNDSFPNDILDTLPDGLREVIVQIRETTNADIRRRNKESRITMCLTADENRNRRKAELRAKMLGLKPPPPLVSNGPVNYSFPCIDVGGLTQQPLKFNPWKLKKKISSKETQQTESNSNILVIDNTNVTLRKKGTSQINEDENSSSEMSRTEDQQTSAEPQGGVDELQEFNTHNYWYISPSSIDIENELLKSPKAEEPLTLSQGKIRIN